MVELAGLNVFTLGGGSGSLFLVNVRRSVNQSKQKQAKKLLKIHYKMEYISIIVCSTRTLVRLINLGPNFFKKIVPLLLWRKSKYAAFIIHAVKRRQL